MQIPNPLFDLAGLTCGHLQVPFWVFFGSTFIGKAINKVSIQTAFIIFAFSKQLVGAYLDAWDLVVPRIAQFLRGAIASQKKALFVDQSKAEAKGDNWIAVVWGWVIIAMVLYFVVSFLNSVVRNKLEKDRK